MRAFRRGERVEAGGGTCAEALARPGVDRGPGGDVPTGCGHPQFPYKMQRRHLQRAAGIETTSFCLCRNLALPPDARGFGTFSVFLIKFFHAPACFVFTRRPGWFSFFTEKKCVKNTIKVILHLHIWYESEISPSVIWRRLTAPLLLQETGSFDENSLYTVAPARS